MVPGCARPLPEGRRENAERGRPRPRLLGPVCEPRAAGRRVLVLGGRVALGVPLRGAAEHPSWLRGAARGQDVPLKNTGGTPGPGTAGTHEPEIVMRKRLLV